MSLGPQGAIGLFLVVGGSLLGAPLVVVLGLCAFGFDFARGVWRDRGLIGLVYERRLERRECVVGDAVPLTISIWNRKALPLPWVRAEDEATEGLHVRERALERGEEFGLALVNGWTLAPYERVVRHFTLVAERRGVHKLGPVRLDVGDLFAGSAGIVEVEQHDRWTVRPRSVPLHGVLVRERWAGDERARRGLLEHPISYAGVRDYAPGDPVRRIHMRTSARLGRPLVKRFDPAREREVLLALDIQTLPGPAWTAAYDDDLVEGLCVTAASIARRLRADGAAFGLAAAAWSGSPRALAYLGPSESASQLERTLDLLARLSSFPSAPFPRLLGSLPKHLRPGATVLILTARDPAPFVPAIRRLTRLGYRVTLLLHGERAEAAVPWRRQLLAGVTTRFARLDGPWSTASRATVE
jgi:uncharacterized protein (DUF58 family)